MKRRIASLLLLLAATGWQSYIAYMIYDTGEGGLLRGCTFSGLAPTFLLVYSIPAYFAFTVSIILEARIYKYFVYLFSLSICLAPFLACRADLGTLG